MRHLSYTNYMSGNAGLSNGVMSIEIGVILAHLTNRFLVLEGNISPPANIVSYNGRVSNERPSRITDLIDLPVPWADSASVDLEGLEALELTDHSLGDVAFYFPCTLDLSSAQARGFARGREHWLTVGEDLDRFPVLRLSESPFVPGTDPSQPRRRNNLCFYSYQFYLDAELRRSVHRLLENMRPKPPFADLAKRVAADLGSFNAVHMRRGDFKVTYGVTTLDRQPEDAIEALDQIFDRNDPLVIVTDERDDPFFRPLTLAYPRHFFIDWHILDAYAADFTQLPQQDSLSLAYLSQLVAAESKNFIGTMTSTFTSLIQRYRGNRGKHEPFRFLWNEIPATGVSLQRGRHAISDCVGLDRGVMIEESEGPYSWNRVTQRINPAWMREWPESFLTPQSLATGAPANISAHPPLVIRAHSGAAALDSVYLTFENLQIAIRSRTPHVLSRVGASFDGGPGQLPCNVITEFEIVSGTTNHVVVHDGKHLGEVADAAQLGGLVKRLAVPILTRARPRHAWLHGAAFTRAGEALVIVGDLADGDDSIGSAMQSAGWDLLESDVVGIRVQDNLVLPFGAEDSSAGDGGRRPTPTPLASIVIAVQQLCGRTALVSLSPAAAVAELITASLDFQIDRNRAVERLCRVAERRPAAQLRFSDAQEAVRLLSDWQDLHGIRDLDDPGDPTVRS